MRFILLIVVVLFPTILAAQVQIDRPADWIELEVPSDLPPEITYLRKVASGDQSVQLTIAAMKPINTVSGAAEVVAGQINGMKKNGFVLESVNDTEVDGFPAKHIRGEFRSDQYEGAYLVDSKVIFSDQATVSVSISIDDARGGRELGDGVFTWIKVSGSPITLEVRPPEPSRNFRIGERIGRYTVYAVVAIALIGIVRRRIQSTNITKENNPDLAKQSQLPD